MLIYVNICVNIFIALFRIKDHVEEAHRARVSDLHEGKNVKQQVELYDAAKSVIEEQRRQVSNLA